MEYSLSMTFLTETGDKSTVNIGGVKNDLTEGDAIALMDILIANNIFINKKGNLVSKYGAKLTQRASTEFEIA